MSGAYIQFQSMTHALLFLGPIGDPELIVILLLGAPLLVVLLVLFLVKKFSRPSIPTRPVEERLALLDGLKNTRRISEEKYQAKRKELIQEL